MRTVIFMLCFFGLACEPADRIPLAGRGSMTLLLPGALGLLPTYYRDERTGLCFAQTWTDTLAHVPCEPVEAARVRPAAEGK